MITALDPRAANLGPSCSEYLRRRLAREANGSTQPLTAAQLLIFAKTFADLADPTILKGAWA